MARTRLVTLLLLILAVALPSSASTSPETVGCTGEIAPDGTASCATTFQIPHFDQADAIDYETLVARIVSPQADSWKVIASIADAKGKVYFVWECAARRSMVSGDSSAYLDRTCAAWRRTGKDSSTYYTARTYGPQVLTVSAWVGGCAPSGTSGCRFEAAATYLLHG